MTTQLQKDLDFLINECKLGDDDISKVIDECERVGVTARYYIEEFTASYYTNSEEN